MTTKRTWITTAAALAMLCTVGCKKQETTPPDTDAEPVESEDVEAPEDTEEPEEPEEEVPTVLSKASFDETINDHMQEVTDCYLAALERDSKLKGKLDAEFAFGADGVPTSVTAAEGSTLTDEGLVQCIADAAKHWGFDPPSEEGMTLRYPFNLAPG